MKRFTRSLAANHTNASLSSIVRGLYDISTTPGIESVAHDPAFRYTLKAFADRLGIDEIDESPELFTKIYDECRCKSDVDSIFSIALRATAENIDYRVCVAQILKYAENSNDPDSAKELNAGLRLLTHTLAAKSKIVRIADEELIELRGTCRSNATMETLLDN